MTTSICVPQITLFVIASTLASELLPERYLKPQDFNHHPFTDVGIPAALKSSTHPYALLAKKRLREGREFPPQHSIYYPKPHSSVIPRKQLESNEITKYNDPYVKIPKNYAFSYIVKDQNSGDDFSHSQAHNGKATRGEYRVKLPDGRTQIVSYTADHKGYRADVQYEENHSPKSVTQGVSRYADTSVTLSQILPGSYQTGSTPTQIAVVESKGSANAVYNLATTPVPAQYISDKAQLKVLVKPTFAPQFHQQSFGPTTLQPQNQPGYISDQYSHQNYVSSTPVYPMSQVSSTVAPHIFQQATVVVTPRPIFKGKNEPNHLALLLRLL